MTHSVRLPRPFTSINRPSRFLLFEGHGNCCIGGKTDLWALNARHEADFDVVMMPRVHPVTAVALFELDAVAYDAIDCADMDTISPDDLHSFFDHVLHHSFLLR